MISAKTSLSSSALLSVIWSLPAPACAAGSVTTEGKEAFCVSNLLRISLLNSSVKKISNLKFCRQRGHLIRQTGHYNLRSVFIFVRFWSSAAFRVLSAVAPSAAPCRAISLQVSSLHQQPSKFPPRFCLRCSQRLPRIRHCFLLWCRLFSSLSCHLTVAPPLVRSNVPRQSLEICPSIGL